MNAPPQLLDVSHHRSTRAALRAGRMWQLARAEPVAAFALLIVIMLVTMALLGPQFAPYGATDVVAADRLQGSGAAHWLGTDQLGRDVLSRMLVGTRLSIYVGFFSVLVGGSIGFAVGMVSAYYGGAIDLVAQRVVDAMIAIPGLILLIAVAAALGSSLTNITIAIGILQVPLTIRVIRSHTLSTREMIFIEAARASGATNTRIIVNHIMPNAVPLLLVLITASIGAAIISESSLSFLGAGVPPPQPTWGNMLNDGRKFMIVAPWLVAVPGAMIVITVMAFNVLGDAIRDLIDPRLRGSRSVK